MARVLATALQNSPPAYLVSEAPGLRDLRPPLKWEGGKRWLVPSSHIIVGRPRESQAGRALLRRAHGHA